ncbi:MAG TPA: nucleotidyltransferase family protein [Sphingobium sp.]|nr:nucleotidyltransferase family protein [Sphingobium sp.]
MSARLLVTVLRDPGTAASLDGRGWTALIAAARAERLIGTLAFRIGDLPVPEAVTAILRDARLDAEREARQALWEANRAVEALAPINVPVLLLKGTAYAAAGLSAGEGRFIGDLDILVPLDRMPDVEALLLRAGWEWVKQDAYDDAYYRQWMHELPPLIHRERDRMIDVHHTILPLTARQRPDAGMLLANAVPISGRLSVLSPEAMVCHAAAHLLADGDLAGGLRNLWDIHRLCCEFSERCPDFFLTLEEEAACHGLSEAVGRALRLSHALYGTPLKAYRSPIRGEYRLRRSDQLFIRRLLARDGWGRETRKPLRFAFYVRSHWLRMPPIMLARHLWTKWRKGHRPV